MGTAQRAPWGGLRRLLWVRKHKVHLQTSRRSLPLFPAWFQTSSSGDLPQSARANNGVDHSARGPSQYSKLRGAAADRQAMKHEKKLCFL